MKKVKKTCWTQQWKLWVSFVLALRHKHMVSLPWCDQCLLCSCYYLAMYMILYPAVSQHGLLSGVWQLLLLFVMLQCCVLSILINLIWLWGWSVECIMLLSGVDSWTVQNETCWIRLLLWSGIRTMRHHTVDDSLLLKKKPEFCQRGWSRIWKEKERVKIFHFLLA